MTTPRSQIVLPDTPGALHCVQRCVRRAFLCGVDRYTGQSFEHRKAWLEDRIWLVAECFAIAIDAYAIMSNHLHLVLRIDPCEAATWHDNDVVARWLRLFAPCEDSNAALESKRQRLLADPDEMITLRQRLDSLSWLMRCLAEPIARSANREDGCKGRFWEGRYKCQALCDERAILAAMVYVDLNPIRAGMTDRLDASAHTSVAGRIAQMKSDPAIVTSLLKPVAGRLHPVIDITIVQYLQILDWTGRQLAPGKRDRITPQAPAILKTMDHDAKCWATRVAAFGGGWYRVVGSAHGLIAMAERLGQQWLKGIRLAMTLG